MLRTMGCRMGSFWPAKRAAVIVSAAALALPGSALAATAGSLSVKKPAPGRNPFQLPHNEPSGSYTLKGTFGVYAICDSRPGHVCTFVFRMYAAKLEKPGLPTRTHVLLTSYTKRLSHGTHTFTVPVVLSHNTLNLLYAYHDPTCILIPVLQSFGLKTVTKQLSLKITFA